MLRIALLTTLFCGCVNHGPFYSPWKEDLQVFTGWGKSEDLIVVARVGRFHVSSVRAYRDNRWYEVRISNSYQRERVPELPLEIPTDYERVEGGVAGRSEYAVHFDSRYWLVEVAEEGTVRIVKRRE